MKSETFTAPPHILKHKKLLRLNLFLGEIDRPKSSRRTKFNAADNQSIREGYQTIEPKHCMPNTEIFLFSLN